MNKKYEVKIKIIRKNNNHHEQFKKSNFFIGIVKK